MIRVTLLVIALWTTTVSASCSICGTNMVVGDTSAQISFPGQPTISCGILELTGTMGLIPQETCLGLPSMLMATCRCHAPSDVSRPGRFLAQQNLRSLQVTDDDDQWASKDESNLMTEATDDDVNDDATDDTVSPEYAGDDTKNDDEAMTEYDYSDDNLEYDSEPLRPESVDTADDDAAQDNEYADSAFEAQMLEIEEMKSVGLTLAPSVDVSPIATPVASSTLSPVTPTATAAPVSN